MLRDGAAGVFLAANTFPKSRETRAPLVEELQRFRDRLPEKLVYLADAPAKDPDGNQPLCVLAVRRNSNMFLQRKMAKPQVGVHFCRRQMGSEREIIIH